MTAQIEHSDYAVAGNPVAHSLSPDIHEMFARQTGETLTYGRLLVPTGGFRQCAERFFAAGGRGMNVTVPCKGDAADWVDELDDEAAFARAVNTIVPVSEGVRVSGGDPRRWKGHNTDGLGLLVDLRRHLTSLKGARVALLGAGGAARGVLRPLLAESPDCVVLANRTAHRAQELASRVRREYPAANLEVCPLGELGRGFDLVINATSAGLTAEVPGLMPEAVQGTFCYDMVYGGETAFCRWAAGAGAAGCVDGLGMLVEQAALAFRLWRGILPDTRPVLAELRGRH